MQKKINSLTPDDVTSFRDHLDDTSNFVGVCDNTIDLYMDLVSKSAIYPGQGTPFGLMYVALGLAEGGEVQNKVKKMFRDDNVLELGPVTEMYDGTENGIERFVPGMVVKINPISEERRAQIIKELGGLAWYFVVVCKELNIRPSDVLLANMIELESRTARNTLSGDGDNR